MPGWIPLKDQSNLSRFFVRNSTPAAASDFVVLRSTFLFATVMQAAIFNLLRDNDDALILRRHAAQVVDDSIVTAATTCRDAHKARGAGRTRALYQFHVACFTAESADACRATGTLCSKTEAAGDAPHIAQKASPAVSSKEV